MRFTRTSNALVLATLLVASACADDEPSTDATSNTPAASGGQAAAGTSASAGKASAGAGGAVADGGASASGGSAGLAAAGKAGASTAGAGGGGSAGAAGAGGAAGPVAKADLRVDTDRDGKVDLDGDTDEAGEDKVEGARGAIFLPNIDDDESSCPSKGSDDELAACNDAADEVINGADDLLDLASMHVAAWPEAPDDASATLSIDDKAADKVRLFRKAGDGWAVLDLTKPFSAADLRAGVELRVEGRDVIRDSDAWDGTAAFTLKVSSASAGAAEDLVQMKVSPIALYHHLQPAERVFVTAISGDPDSMDFRDDLQAGVEAAKVPEGLHELGELNVYGDQWTQDFFEPAYVSMPGEGGKPHVIKLNLRSANVYDGKSKTRPLRDAGRWVFTHWRGKDRGGVQAYDPKHDPNMDSLNSFGNTETIPPYTKGGETFAHGRMLRGSVPPTNGKGGFYPDPVFSKLLESQGLQPPVYIDTSWLLVGHVDETTSFVKSSSPRGWVLLINDARMARKMIEDAVAAGNGNVKMFVGKKWWGAGDNEVSATVTLSQVLNDPDVMSMSQQAAAAVDEQLAKIRKATGITEADIVRIPFLHQPADGYAVAYQPGIVNGIYLADDLFGPPDPHGPLIDGVDIFKDATEKALAEHGVKVHWIEDWNLYHRNDGEVHCGSNTQRRIADSDPFWKVSP